MESVIRLGRRACPEWMAEDILHRVQADRRVQNMRNFIQHGRVSTYDHCERVARLSYRIDRRLNLGGDPQVLLQGAMLHDFFCTTGTTRTTAPTASTASPTPPVPAGTPRPTWASTTGPPK